MHASPPPSTCSQKCVYGIRAAHWAALRTTVDKLGGLPRNNATVYHMLLDLLTIGSSCNALLADASLTTLLSEAISRTAPFLFKASLTCNADSPRQFSVQHTPWRSVNCCQMLDEHATFASAYVCASGARSRARGHPGGRRDLRAGCRHGSQRRLAIIA